MSLILKEEEKKQSKSFNSSMRYNLIFIKINYINTLKTLSNLSFEKSTMEMPYYVNRQTLCFMLALCEILCCSSLKDLALPGWML